MPYGKFQNLIILSQLFGRVTKIFLKTEKKIILTYYSFCVWSLIKASHLKNNSNYFSYNVSFFPYTPKSVNSGVPVRSKVVCLREHADGLGTLLTHKLPCRNAI